MPRRRRGAGRRGHRRARCQHAVHGSLRAPDAASATPCSGRRAPRAWRSRRRARSAGIAGSGSAAPSSACGHSGPRLRRRRLRPFRHHGRGRRPPGSSTPATPERWDMASAPQTVNARLAALVAAGTAPWLDQIRRGLISSGELERLRDEYSLRGVTSNPAIFEQAILGSSDYDDELRELAARGPRGAAAVRAHRDRRPPGCGRRAAAGLRGARRRLRLVGGHARLRQRHRADARPGPRLLRAPRPAQRLHQDPGHGRRRSGDRAGDLRGHQRQRHAAVRRRALREVAEAYIRGLERRAGRGAVARRPFGRELLRLARRHRGRQAPRGARSQRPRRHRRHRQRARRLRPLRGDLPRRALRRAARRRRARCSARCGPRPGSRTRPTRRRSTSTGWSPPTPSTRCR